MKKIISTLAILITFALGIVAGGTFMFKRGVNRLHFFLGGQLSFELRMQEETAFLAYSTASPETAIWALQQLLRTYLRYKAFQGIHPGLDAMSMKYGQAMAHARLARIFTGNGDSERYREHLEKALKLSDEPNAEVLFMKLEIFDRVQKKQFGQQGRSG